jgi:hypothetical protein
MPPGVTLIISELLAKRLEMFNGAMPPPPSPRSRIQKIRTRKRRLRNPHRKQTFCGLPQLGKFSETRPQCCQSHQKVPNPRLLHAH